MLGRFPGKARESALPRNQIELVCPLCGAVQKEPRLVQTTFCRKCGEHLRMEKGRVIASARINPVPSAVYPAMMEPAPPAAEEAPRSPVEPDAKKEEAVEAPSSAPPPRPASADRAEERSVRQVRQIQGTDWPPAAAPQPAVHRTRESSGPVQHYFKEVECFECGGRLKVGRSARSASCSACSAHIRLEDIDVSSNSTSSIRTRGDVVIGKSANLQATEVRCRNLKLFGALSAAIDCSGEFFVRASGALIGEVRCHRLVIDKGSDIQFVNSIFADEVEVRGRVLGHVQCSGAVSITSSGLVHGDVTARAVSIEPGGQIDGAMNIVRTPVARPLGPMASPAGGMPRLQEKMHPPGGGTRRQGMR